MQQPRADEPIVFRETERPLRVLVIDDDKAVRTLLTTILSAEGINVTSTDCHHEARSLIERQSYDLLMIEESLPSRQGVALLEELRIAGVETPALVMTTYPTAEMLDAAFEAGASDFIKKPFAGISHLVSRACSVAEQGTTDKFYERLLGDLSAAARADGPFSDVYRRAVRSCKETRAMLERRPAAVIIDRDIESASAVASLLEEEGHEAETISDPARALARFTNPRGPLVLIIDLGVAGALSTVARARATSAPPEIVVLGGPEHLHDALQGVDLGAGDYCLRDERRRALTTRVTRAVERARRRLLKQEVLDLVRTVCLEIERLEGGGPDTSITSQKRDSGRTERKRREPLDKRVSSSRRFEVDLSAIVTGEGLGGEHVRVKDVSARGMFVATADPAPRGTRLRVYVDTGSVGMSRPIEVACQVRWNVRYDPDPSCASGMGVSLLDGEADTLAPLLELLRRR